MDNSSLISEQGVKDNSRNNLNKLHSFILEFEKEFQSISKSKEINDKNSLFPEIDNLNNSLILITNLSSLEKLNDFIKLSEASSVFLNYIKDRKIDFFDDKIQAVIKFIIDSFKRLFLNKETKDFDLFVRYLNNPVEIIVEK